MIRYSDRWNFMFIQLFVQELFHFSQKTENFDNFKMSHNFWPCSPSWVFFKFFKLYKWYQIAQSIAYISWIIINKTVNKWIICKCVFESSRYNTFTCSKPTPDKDVKYVHSAVSCAILKPVYRFGIPNSDPQTLKSVKINSSKNRQMTVHALVP